MNIDIENLGKEEERKMNPRIDSQRDIKFACGSQPNLW